MSYRASLTLPSAVWTRLEVGSAGGAANRNQTPFVLPDCVAACWPHINRNTAIRLPEYAIMIIAPSRLRFAC